MNFDRFLQKACPPRGLDWRKYRRRAARHRVEGRMRELGLDDFAAYLEFLTNNPAEAAGLADLMLVTVSRFFRDRNCWIRLVREVLPRLMGEKSGKKILRVWSVGCCGGEEPYSLALVWLEYLQPHFPACTMKILATDIDEASLERAHMGRYGTGSLREVPNEIRDRWFRPAGGIWLIDDRVKDLVRFAKGNLMTDQVPSGINLVLCRYFVFTYYRDERRFEAAQRLYGALQPAGVLMIGLKERIDTPELRLFEPWPGTGCIYRKAIPGT